MCIRDRVNSEDLKEQVNSEDLKEQVNSEGNIKLHLNQHTIEELDELDEQSYRITG